jgi:hypothetical protein
MSDLWSLIMNDPWSSGELCALCHLWTMNDLDFLNDEWSVNNKWGQVTSNVHSMNDLCILPFICFFMMSLHLLILSFFKFKPNFPILEHASSSLFWTQCFAICNYTFRKASKSNLHMIMKLCDISKINGLCAFLGQYL